MLKQSLSNDVIISPLAVNTRNLGRLILFA